MKKKPTSEELKKELEIFKKTNSSQYLLNSKGALFVELDKNGIVKNVNKKTCETLKYKEEEILGKNWFKNFIPINIREKIFMGFKKIPLGKAELSEFYENPILAKNGEEYIIYWHNVFKKVEVSI